MSSARTAVETSNNNAPVHRIWLTGILLLQVAGQLYTDSPDAGHCFSAKYRPYAVLRNKADSKTEESIFKKLLSIQLDI